MAVDLNVEKYMFLSS